MKAINDGDIDTLASLTTEGHMMISSGGPPLTGKKALVDAMTRAFQTTDFDECWAPQETVVSGDLAYQRGTFVVVSKPKAGGTEVAHHRQLSAHLPQGRRRLVHGARLVQQSTAAQ